MTSSAKSVIAAMCAIFFLLAGCSGESAPLPGEFDEATGSAELSVETGPSLNDLLERDARILSLEPVDGPLVSTDSERDNPVKQRLEDIGLKFRGTEPGPWELLTDGDVAERILVQQVLDSNGNVALVERNSRGECPFPISFGWLTREIETQEAGWYVIESDTASIHPKIDYLAANTRMCESRPDPDAAEAPEISEEGNLVGVFAVRIKNAATLEYCESVLSDYAEIEWKRPHWFDSLSECAAYISNADNSHVRRLRADSRIAYVSAVAAQIFSDDAKIKQAESEWKQLFPETLSKATAIHERGWVDGTFLVGNQNPIPDLATGRGVLVYVVDTGVHVAHPEFLLFGHGANVDEKNKRMVSGASTSFRLPQDTCNGHGTHVASLSLGRTVGIAPDAILVPVSVGLPNCSGAMGFANLGLEWVLADVVARTEAARRAGEPPPKFVVNNSWGAHYDEKRCSSRKDQEECLNGIRTIQALKALGGIIVKAAGNDHRNLCTDGRDRSLQDWADNAVIVGALRPIHPTEDLMGVFEGLKKFRENFPKGFWEWYRPIILSGFSASSANLADDGARRKRQYEETLEFENEYYTSSMEHANWSEVARTGVAMTVLETSNYGSCIDLWANGLAYAASNFHRHIGTPNAPMWTFKGGTSMAAPLVAGAAAAWLERHGRAGDPDNLRNFTTAAQATGTPLEALLVSDTFTPDDITDYIRTEKKHGAAWQTQSALHFPGLLSLQDSGSTLPRLGEGTLSIVGGKAHSELTSTTPSVGSNTTSASRDSQRTRPYVQFSPQYLMIGDAPLEFDGDLNLLRGNGNDCWTELERPIPVNVEISGQRHPGWVVACYAEELGDAPPSQFSYLSIVKFDSPVGTVNWSRIPLSRTSVNSSTPMRIPISFRGQGLRSSEPNHYSCLIRVEQDGKSEGCWLQSDQVRENQEIAYAYLGLPVAYAYADAWPSQRKRRVDRQKVAYTSLAQIYDEWVDYVRARPISQQIDGNACLGVPFPLVQVCVAANTPDAKALNQLCDQSAQCKSLLPTFAQPMRSGWEDPETRQAIVVSTKQVLGNPSSLTTPRFAAGQQDCHAQGAGNTAVLRSLRNLAREDAAQTGISTRLFIPGDECSLGVDLPVVAFGYADLSNADRDVPDVRPERLQFQGTFDPSFLARYGSARQAMSGLRNVSVVINVQNCEGCWVQPVTYPLINGKVVKAFEGKEWFRPQMVDNGRIRFAMPEWLIPTLVLSGVSSPKDVYGVWTQSPAATFANGTWCYSRPVRGDELRLTMRAQQVRITGPIGGEEEVLTLLYESGMRPPQQPLIPMRESAWCPMSESQIPEALR